MYSSVGFTNVNHFPAVDGRKLDPKTLLETNLISIRSYDDLLSGRNQSSGLPSLGAVGCTLSHYNLWDKCVKDNLPYIIIAEDDNEMMSLSSSDLAVIYDILKKPNSVFLSGNLKTQDHRTHFYGTHFYIASNQACNILASHTFPIDVQTDWYMAHMHTIGKIFISGYPISYQNKSKSTIQDTCVLCFLPKGWKFYMCLGVCVIILLGIIFILIITLRERLFKCREECT